MRLSVIDSDPGFRTAQLTPGARGARVFLDGIERTSVITADEERRLLVRVCTDQAGNVRFNGDRTEVLTETLYGDVRIELPVQQPAPGGRTNVD